MVRFSIFLHRSNRMTCANICMVGIFDPMVESGENQRFVMSAGSLALERERESEREREDVIIVNTY